MGVIGYHFKFTSKLYNIVRCKLDSVVNKGRLHHSGYNEDRETCHFQRRIHEAESTELGDGLALVGLGEEWRKYDLFVSSFMESVDGKSFYELEITGRLLGFEGKIKSCCLDLLSLRCFSGLCQLFISIFKYYFMKPLLSNLYHILVLNHSMSSS